jgi:hypothetical protein
MQIEKATTHHGRRRHDLLSETMLGKLKTRETDASDDTNHRREWFQFVHSLSVLFFSLGSSFRRQFTKRQRGFAARWRSSEHGIGLVARRTKKSAAQTMRRSLSQHSHQLRHKSRMSSNKEKSCHDVGETAMRRGMEQDQRDHTATGLSNNTSTILENQKSIVLECRPEEDTR